jgi:hypothetical protein
MVLNVWQWDWLFNGFMARCYAHDVVIRLVVKVQLIQLLAQRLWAGCSALNWGSCGEHASASTFMSQRNSLFRPPG